MTAREKLAEANFFLQKLKAASKVELAYDFAVANEYRYYVSACVWALYGSYDHLLYDYAQKYWPKLDISDFLDNKMFALLADATDNDEAKRFLEWYREVQGRIDKNEDAHAILKVRRIEGHRGTTAYSFYSYFEMPSLHDVVTASGAFRMGQYDPSGMANPTEFRPLTWPVVKSVVNFNDYPGKPVEQVIEAVLTLLSAIVTEAENNFGIPKPVTVPLRHLRPSAWSGKNRHLRI